MNDKVSDMSDKVNDVSISKKVALDALGRAEGAIGNLPSAQPERKTGKWKGYNTDKDGWKRTDGSPVFLICSECGGTVLNNGSAHWNYCPNCGTKMEE